MLLRVPCVVQHTAEPRGPKRTWQGMAPVAVCGLCSAFGRGQYGAPPYSTWRAHHGPCAAYTPTFHSKSNLVCTRVGYFDAVGAGRAARHRPLGGREGAGIACTLAANAQRGVPGRIVMCHPNPPVGPRRNPGPLKGGSPPQVPSCLRSIDLIGVHLVPRGYTVVVTADPFATSLQEISDHYIGPGKIFSAYRENAAI